jgi:hypothetical protein
MAIWQFCVDEFHRLKRSGKTGTQVVLPNFTAVPVPEFNLLWRQRTDRFYPRIGETKEQKYILIEIELHWTTTAPEEKSFSVQLRYNSFATWRKKKSCRELRMFPHFPVLNRPRSGGTMALCAGKSGKPNPEASYGTSSGGCTTKVKTTGRSW